MSAEYTQYWVHENSFGASTSLTVKIENGKVVESLDTSSYETNYSWDGGFEDGLLDGKSKQEAEEIMDHWFDDFEDEYRRPYINKTELSSADWTRIKAQRLKEEKIRSNIEKGVSKRQERYKAGQEHKDMLAEKERLLEQAERRLHKHTGKKALSETKDMARFKAYQKFSQGRSN